MSILLQYVQPIASNITIETVIPFPVIVRFLTTLDQHTYTLDNVGNRTQLAEVLAQVGGGSISPTTTYGYDHAYRLRTDGTNNYVYDPVGNRLV